jgi:fructose-bisphosphate aldolase class II
LTDVIARAEREGHAVAHFNVSELATLKAIAETARRLSLPVIIGASEGERQFLGLRQIAALVRTLREDLGSPLYLNADHTHSIEGAESAAAAGYDAVVFDGSKLPFAENVRRTRDAVERVRSVVPEMLVEGELGFIGSGSTLVREVAPGVAQRPDDLTTPEQAAEFVRATGVDLLAPAVGNLHGLMIGPAPPRLDIPRIARIRSAAGVPLVLHGGSGLSDADLGAAIQAGIRVVHINTELRVAWRRGLETGLAADADEVAPYKILAPAIAGVSGVVESRMRLFRRPR